ncbi:MAG: trypsin-like peptidase domain-containing protein [Nitrospinae bacterium]|nr:trypsin-like peptidase domain-containing protein [Nitrospinota bacterium]
MKSLLILLVLLLSGCGQEAEFSTIKAIIEKDDRKSVSNSSIRSLVGKIISPLGTCTGYISGQTELTTALHCVDMAHTSEVTFITDDNVNIPILSQKEYFEKADIVKINIPKQDKFLELAKFNPNLPINVFGFDTISQTLLKDQCISTEKSNDMFPGVIFHGCDTVKGTSGAPLLQDGKVVGLHVGTVANHTINVAVDLSYTSTINLFDIVYEPERNCDAHLRRYRIFKKEEKHWSIAAGITMGAGSFFGGFGGLAGAAPAAVSAERAMQAKNQLKAHKKCLKEEAKKAAAKRKREEQLNDDLADLK